VKTVQDESLAERAGLCACCHFMRQMKSDRGAIFIRCELSATDASFPKYPRLPVLQCAGYRQRTTKKEDFPPSSGMH
jgi:hypothetical protein